MIVPQAKTEEIYKALLFNTTMPYFCLEAITRIINTDYADCSKS